MMISLTDLMKRPSVHAKLPGQRKEREWVVYPWDGEGPVTVQTDGAIVAVDLKNARTDGTASGVGNLKGEYFHHLSPSMGAHSMEFPASFVEQVRAVVEHDAKKRGNAA